MKHPTGRRGILASALFFSVLKPVAEGAGVACGEFECHHGGKCQDGPPNFDDHRLNDGSLLSFHQQQPSQQKQETQAHCECPPRYTGLSCDIPYQDCGSNHKCYFGGQCFFDLEGVLENDELFCDCSRATDDNGGIYVGKYCEHLLSGDIDQGGVAFQTEVDYAIPSRVGTTECHLGGTFDDYVCLNDGTCNPEYPASSKQPCYCRRGYTGPNCEYEESTVPDCTLPCTNGGQCQLGRPPETDEMAFSRFRQTVIGTSFMYCDCLDGFFGDLCEVQATPCGEEYCFNDAECLEGVLTLETGTSNSCGCQHMEEASYAGKYCQYEATSYCPKAGNFEGDNFFCANGGHCKDDAWQGCDCPQGYSGFSCGYFTGGGETEDDLSNCDLDCNGRGTCVVGVKDLGYLGEAVNAKHLNSSSSNEQQYCACKTGFTGLQCEHEVAQCGGEEGSHFCMHGTKCVDEGDGKYSCDCSSASSQLSEAFAGEHCEHPATSICSSKVGEDDLAFCTNEGTCQESETASGSLAFVCNCPEGWDGPHCALKSDSLAEEKIGNEMKSVARFLFAIGLCLLFVAILGTYLGRSPHKYRFVNARRQLFASSRPAYVANKWPTTPDPGSPVGENLSPYKEKTILDGDEFNRAFQASSNPIPLPIPLNDPEADSPTLFMGPPCDEDGNELSEVSII